MRYFFQNILTASLFVSQSSMVFAADTGTSISTIACSVVKLALSFVPLLVVIAIIFFLQGLIKYIAHGDNEEKRTEGTKMMIYGIVGFFFIASIWGVVNLVTNSFGLGNAMIPQLKGAAFSCQ